MSNSKKVLYIGVTNDLTRRVLEHKLGLVEGFTKRYFLRWLVYFSEFNTPQEAIEQEKRIKGWTRDRKLELVATTNPTFKDLWKESFKDPSLPQDDKRV